ncbi:kinase-like domain-containing protein, partial [Thelonectria olida]
FGCLLGAVCSLYDLEICHQNIKPGNILVKDGRVLLADFGISHMVICRAFLNRLPPRIDGSMREYYAPEVDEKSISSLPGDIFSLGAVFLEMLITCAFP